MRRSIVVLAGILCALVTQPAAQQGVPAATAQGRAYLESAVFARAAQGERVRVIVALRPPALDVSGNAVVESVAEIGNRVLARLPRGKAVTRFSELPVLAMSVDAAELEALRNSPDVAGIRVDQLRKPRLSESVPLIGAPTAWAAGATGVGWAVAVLDTGVDKTHPFLSGKVVSEACYSTTDPGSLATSVCPGGINSTANGSGVACSSGVAGCSHGTHLAGIAAGTGTSFSGVAKNASLVSIQVYSRIDSAAFCSPDPSPCVGAFDSDVLAGLNRVYALRHSVKIASALIALGSGSYTSTCDAAVPDYKSAIDLLRGVGIATVVSAGNQGLSTAIEAPACVSTAVSVGATDKNDQLASYSNRNPHVSLVAPGTAIYSPEPGGFFSFFSGTSMSAAHVAGAWALMKGVRPTGSVPEVLSALASTAVPIPDAAAGTTRSRIDIAAAVPAIQQMRSKLPDFDGQQSGDIFWRHSTPGRFSAWLINGATVTGTSTYNVGTEWRPALFGDVNGDGRSDIMWRSQGTIAFWLMNGTALQGSAFYGVGPEWALSAAGDVTGDGRADLVWRSPSNGMVAFWYMNGTTLIGSSFFGVGREWDLLGAGDVDGNGADDLVWRNTSGTTLVWFMNGGALQSTASFGAGSEWSLVGLGDLNGDGRDDLLWRHNVMGTLAIWLMDGSTLLSPAFVAVGPEWALVGAGDVNSDGKADLVWHRSGTVAIWFMNGGALQGTTFFGVGREWTPVGAQ
jgi:subtilisin